MAAVGTGTWCEEGSAVVLGDIVEVMVMQVGNEVARRDGRCR